MKCVRHEYFYDECSTCLQNQLAAVTAELAERKRDLAGAEGRIQELRGELSARGSGDTVVPCCMASCPGFSGCGDQAHCCMLPEGHSAPHEYPCSRQKALKEAVTAERDRLQAEVERLSDYHPPSIKATWIDSRRLETERDTARAQVAALRSACQRAIDCTGSSTLHATILRDALANPSPAAEQMLELRRLVMSEAVGDLLRYGYKQWDGSRFDERPGVEYGDIVGLYNLRKAGQS